MTTANAQLVYSAQTDMDGDATVEPEITSIFLRGIEAEHIHVQRCGPTAAVPLVMIHGYGEGAYVWTNVIRHFHRSYAMVAIDLPGHGRSNHRPGGNYATPSMVEEVTAILDQMGLERFILIGHSWGGEIALRLAAQTPQRVLGIVVVDTGPEDNPEAMEHVRSSLNLSMRHYRSVDEYARWLMENRPLASPSDIKRIAHEATRRRDDGMFELRLDAALTRRPRTRRDSLWPILPKIEADVLLVRGQMSGVLSVPMAEKMGRGLRRCRLRTVARAGHGVMLDNPQGFISILSPFLTGALEICK